MSIFGYENGTPVLIEYEVGNSCREASGIFCGEENGFVIISDSDSRRQPIRADKIVSIVAVKEIDGEADASETIGSISSNVEASEIAEASVRQSDANNTHPDLQPSRTLSIPVAPTFHSMYWGDDYSKITISPELETLCQELDSTGKLIKELRSLLDKYRYMVKIDECSEVYGRAQGILVKTNALCEKYPADFLYDLLGIVLVTSRILYKEQFTKPCLNSTINLASAVVYFLRNRFEEMTYYLNEYYSNRSLDDSNVENYLFARAYLVEYGYGHILELRDPELATIGQQEPPPLSSLPHSPIVSGPSSSQSAPPKTHPGSSFAGKEAADVIKELLKRAEYMEAYRLSERKFKENPEDADIAEVFQYAARVRTNANKHKNAPKDNSLYSQGWRAWNILEDPNLAKSLYLSSIRAKEPKYISAIMDYVEVVMHADGDLEAVEALKDYSEEIKKTNRQSRIKYWERLSTLYLKLKDFDSLLDCLNSLKQLYSMSKHKKSGREKYRLILFRISQCHSHRGDFESSIAACEEALDNGYNLYSCINQIVSCYLSMGLFEDAQSICRQYAARDYRLVSLEERINELKRNSADSENGGMAQEDVLGLLGLEIPFIVEYESSCDYEGFTEEQKERGQFSENELDSIAGRISGIRRNRFKDHAALNLTVACIEKSNNGTTERYYRFLSRSMLNYGHLMLIGRKFDSAKSYYLAAIDLSKMTKTERRVEEESACYCVYSILCEEKTVGDLFNSESELLLVLPKLIDGLNDDHVVNGLCQLINSSQFFKTFLEKHCTEKLFEALCSHKFIADSLKDLWTYAERKETSAQKAVNAWYAQVQLDHNFENDILKQAVDVKNCMWVTNCDIGYIDKFLEYYSDIRDYRVFSDFDNKIRILSQAQNSLKDLRESMHKLPTSFSENYLTRIIDVTFQNLNRLITHISEYYVAEIEVDIPITNVPIDNGHARISVSITNRENRAAARDLSLLATDVSGKQLFKKRLEINLRGGATVSDMIDIAVSGEEAFTINVIVQYLDEENQSHSSEKQVSISTDLETFAPIQNPYITGKPVIDDNMFFGREDLVNRLAESLKDDRVRCVVIYGQKRTGKTSIFKHLQKELDDDFIVLSFSVGSDITSERNFYRSVQGEIVHYLEDDYDDDTISIFEDYTINDLLDFQQFIAKFNRQICKKQHRELLLLIDEFTHIYTYINSADRDIDSTFMDKWKAMIEKNLFKSALIGQDFMLDFIREYANQFQVTDPIKVTYLAKRDALALVSEPISLSDGESRFLEDSDEMIVRWFNGQPYYLQTYCDKLVNYLNGEQRQNFVTAAIAIKVKNQMLSETHEDFFDNLIQSNETDLFDAVLAIAKEAGLASDWAKQARLPVCICSERILDKLDTRGVIEYKKAEQKCRILIPFFQEWLLSYY